MPGCRVGGASRIAYECDGEAAGRGAPPGSEAGRRSSADGRGPRSARPPTSPAPTPTQSGLRPQVRRRGSSAGAGARGRPRTPAVAVRLGYSCSCRLRCWPPSRARGTRGRGTARFRGGSRT